MPTSSTDRPTTPPTVWPARGRHVGTTARDVLLRTLRRHQDDGVLDDFHELPREGADEDQVFEARWRVAEDVTVRARLTLAAGSAGSQEWTLLAEAEEHWDPRWPSPAGMFWPDDPDVPWDRDAATGLRTRVLNALPDDDKAVRRLLRDAGRDGWLIHVVVHEAMTPDHRGRVPLVRWLPPSLRHRVVEHRAAPQQLRVVNWALEEFGVQVPRGGAVVLPGTPAPPEPGDLSVRSVFLDGSEPAELVATVGRFAVLERPLPDGGEAALTALREDWRLLTLQEELERQRRLVTMYAEALEAMTRSRDLYREAAERAGEALAALRESTGTPEVRTEPSEARPASPLRALTRGLERWKGASAARSASAGTDRNTPATPARADRDVPAERPPED